MAAAPFGQYRTEVRAEWIDYNGHLHDAGYAIVLSEANEALLAHLGLSEAYRTGTGRAMYTVESHIRYLAEAARGDVIEAASLLVSADAKGCGYTRCCVATTGCRSPPANTFTCMSTRRQVALPPCRPTDGRRSMRLFPRMPRWTGPGISAAGSQTARNLDAEVDRQAL